MAVNTVEFGSTLQTCGYKLTIQRQTVLETIIKNRDKHLSIEEIFDEVKRLNPHIGLATVYRTIQLFKKIGLVRHINLNDGCLRYQMADPEEKHEHHHLICERCGEVIDMQEDLLESFEEKVLLKKGFRVTDHKVQFWGICRACTEAAGNDKKENEK